MRAEARFRGDSSPFVTGSFLEVADRIGATLCRDAIWSGRRCTWMGWSIEILDGAFVPAYRVSNPSLYDGLAGVALFLSRLQRYTGDPLQKAAARGAADNLIAQLDDPAQPLGAGLYSGLAGIGVALAGVGEALGAHALIERGLQAAEAGGRAAIDPVQSDVLGGSAGIIQALMALGERFERPDFHDLAAKHGDALVERAVESPRGIAWPNPMPNEQPLLGYSHGTAGCALALSELHRVRPEERYARTAAGALRYERSFFDPGAANWPDLRLDPRSPGAGPRYPSAWCHGAAGVGLSRLRLRDLVGEGPEILQEIDAALKTASGALVSQQTTGITDFSYCHGSAGNAELLLDVGLAMGRADILEGVRRFGDLGAQSFAARGLPWACGVSGAGETPGLLQGTAGIGWFYLRLHDPEEVPSLLVIHPNKQGPKV